MGILEGTRRAVLALNNKRYNYTKGQYIPSGKSFYVSFNYIHTSGTFTAGLYSNAAGTGNPLAGINPTSTEMKLQIGATTIEAYTLTAVTAYQVVIEYDGTFTRWMIKGGTEYTVWTELYRERITLGSAVYLCFGGTGVVTTYNIHRNYGSYPYSETPTRFVTLRFSSAGAFTFDPTITTSAGTATWVFGDGTSTVGNAISVSKTGYMLVKVTGVVASVILTLDANTDNLAGDLSNINPLGLTNINSLILHTNILLTGGLSSLSTMTKLTYLNINTCPLLTGDLSSLSTMTSLGYLSIANNDLLTGNLSSLSAMTSMVTLFANGCTLLTGNLSSLSAMTKLINLYLYNTDINGTTGLGTCIKLQNVRVYSCAWTQAEVDAVLTAIYTTRMAYTYASTIVLQIGGTNAAPSGTYQIPPNCGAVTSGKEIIYELVNDSCASGHKRWSVTYTA